LLLLLSLFYFLNFATVGAFFPWYPPLLAGRGFSPALIGTALATGSIARMVFTPFWGYLADRWHARREIMFGCTLLATVCLAGTASARSVPATLGWIFLYGFFVVPIFPLAEAAAFALLGDRRERYGRVRLWGSFGFIVTSQGLGLLVRPLGLGAVPWIAAGFMALAGAVALLLPGREASRTEALAREGLDPAAAPRPDGHSFGALRAALPWRTLLVVFVAAALGQAAHGPYYDFFTLRMEARSVAPWAIGSLWTLGVAAEIALMAAGHRVLSRLGLTSAMRWALALGAARWALFACVPSLPFVVAGQVLHAASFGLLHLATVSLTDRLTPPGRKALGQTLVSMWAYGLGGGAGLLLAGQLRGPLGDAGLYAAAAAACLAGLAVTAGLPRGGPR
jgi:PPP family 3-phenylpropionic acid transporter